MNLPQSFKHLNVYLIFVFNNKFQLWITFSPVTRCKFSASSALCRCMCICVQYVCAGVICACICVCVSSDSAVASYVMLLYMMMAARLGCNLQRDFQNRAAVEGQEYFHWRGGAASLLHLLLLLVSISSHLEDKKKNKHVKSQLWAL